MSCQIKLTANIISHIDIRKSLFPFDPPAGNENWLQSCELSVSPCGDIIAIAREDRLIILTGKWDATNSITNFHETCSYDFSDTITSVLCLPIVAQGHSSQVGPDWTCIAVGFQSGHIRFYTEDCMLLLEEHLHNESIISIKCQSQHSPRPDIASELKPEEVYVQYPSNLCVINGAHLFSTLRSCRAYLAKVQASGNSVEPSNNSLNPKKWGFADQNSVGDAVVVGLDLSNTFDHLLTASTCGGFETRYRAMPPHNNLVLGAGNKPYVGFHYALEGGAQPVLSDVAKAVANKLKSALPGWLTGGKTQVEKQASVTFTPSEAMACRFGLCDLRRTAVNIVLSPNKRLSAVSDTLGRVILIDTHKGVAIRIFKGYRDAQCAFIQVPDERKSKSRSRKIALFLIIYSSKKGTLEIFSAQLGTKIATFTASKHSRLLYFNYGLMGFQSMSKTRYICQYTTIFIDADGSIKEVIVPFHYSLTESNSVRARDLHLYKRLKQFVKTNNYTQDDLLNECFNTCTELKTIEVKLQLLEFLTSCKETFPEIILKCGNYLVEKYSTPNVAEVDADVKLLKTLCANLCSLVNFHSYVTSTGEDDSNGNLPPNVVDTESIVGPKDMANLQKLLDLSTMNNFKSLSLKVCFEENGHYVLSSFLRVFDLGNPEHISLKQDVEDAVLFQTAQLIFKQYITRSCDASILKVNIKSSRILIDDLFRLLLIYWENRTLSIDVNLEREMQNFSSVVYALAENADNVQVVVEYNQISPFWATIRQILMNSSKSFPALMAATICKGVAQHIQGEQELQDSLEDDLDVWEELSQETCQWILLIGKLEDVSLLNIILAGPPRTNPVLPCIKQKQEIVSLRYILQKGKGSVSELVAKWLTSGGIDPKLLLLNDRVLRYDPEKHFDDHEDFVLGDDLKLVRSEGIFEHLNILKKQFPYSLTSDVLLTNMCWEYATSWQKEVANLNVLDAAVKCMNEIENPYLRVGLHLLFWNTRLKQLFEIVTKLINKVGKLPVERLCKQDTGLTDLQVTTFTETCVDFFNTFMNSVQDSYKTEKVKLSYEPIWELDGTLPLAQLALNHSSVNYDLLLLHFQISECLLMITTFQIKHSKFIHNLLDPLTIPLCFSDFQRKLQISWHRSESRTNESRMTFLMKVIAATIETITVNDDKVYCSDHVKWMGRCVNLARMWNMDVDFLRRFQLVQLYVHGYDTVAKELIPAVNEPKILGPELLEVAGRRLAQYLASSESIGETIAACSVPVTQYLEKLGSDWVAPSSAQKTMALASSCLRCFEDDRYDYKLATLMIEACETLCQMEKAVKK